LPDAIWAVWIQTAAISVSAGAAFWLVHESRKIARKKSTVELIMRMRLDKEYLETRDAFKALREKHTSLAEYAKPAHKEAEERKTILDALNNHEYIACGIAEGALDEEIYKRMLGSVVIKDWESAETFVTDLRNDIKIKDPVTARKLFIEFQSMAEHWRDQRAAEKSKL